MLDADDGGEAFADVVSRETVVLEQILLFRIAIHTTGQGGSQAGHVRPSVLVSNDVRVAKNVLAEGIGPLKSKFNRHRALLDFFLT